MGTISVISLMRSYVRCRSVFLSRPERYLHAFLVECRSLSGHRAMHPLSHDIVLILRVHSDWTAIGKSSRCLRIGRHRREIRDRDAAGVAPKLLGSVALHSILEKDHRIAVRKTAAPCASSAGPFCNAQGFMFGDAARVLPFDRLRNRALIT
jgi:hypothetical protein